MTKLTFGWCSKRVDWLVLAGLIGIIYGTLPYGPRIINSVYSNIGKEVFALTLFIIAVSGAIATFAYTSSYEIASRFNATRPGRSKKEISKQSSYEIASRFNTTRLGRSKKGIPILSGFFEYVTIGYVARILFIGGILYYMGRLITVPAVRLHFIEYALLGVAIERVLRQYVQNISRPFLAMLFAYFVGMGDETIQWILPNRHGEIMDVFLNGWGGVLGISLLPWPQQGLTLPSHRLIFLMLTIAIMSSILFTFGTRDFGHMIVDERKGFRFKSRLSPEDLREHDLKNGTSLGRILKQDISLPYRQYLVKYPANKYPFLHEMRVHIFRRDRYAKKGRAKASWIALRENQVLESYFGRTLNEAGLNWPEAKMRSLGERCSTWESLSYTSSVSNKVITAFSSFHFAMMGVGLLCLNCILFLITRRRVYAEPTFRRHIYV